MTAPGKNENDNTTNSENPDGTAANNKTRSRFSDHDLIPIPLVIGIFAAIMCGTWFLLKDNWVKDMTRFRSIRAERKGDWPKAAGLLQELITAGAENDDRMTSNSPTYLSEMGFCYMRQEKYDEALRWYKMAQANSTNMPPDDQGNPRPPADFNNTIGYIQMQTGNLDAAEKSLKTALTFNKLDPLANFEMGELAMKRKNYVNAADYFKVVASNPSYEDRVKKYYAEIENKLFADIK